MFDLWETAEVILYIKKIDDFDIGFVTDILYLFSQFLFLTYSILGLNIY